MFTKGVLNNGKEIDYAFGLFVDNYRGKIKISHAGGWAGYRTTLHYYPEEKLGIVILSNFASFNPDHIAEKIANIYLDIPPKKKKEIKVNPDIFNQYVGRYQVTPNYFAEVTREGDKLMVQATNQPQYQAFPESETKYFLKVLDAHMTFLKDENGKVNEVILHQRGSRDIIAKRVSIKSWNPGNLQEYTGVYYCHEIDARYSVILKENRLCLTHYRHGECNLEPQTLDKFSGDTPFLTPVIFLREGNGKLTGFRIDGSTSKNFIFKKM